MVYVLMGVSGCGKTTVGKRLAEKLGHVAILGGAGGASVTMTDMAEKEGLKVPQLTPKSIQSLGEFIPPPRETVSKIPWMPLLIETISFHAWPGY